MSSYEFRHFLTSSPQRVFLHQGIIRMFIHVNYTHQWLVLVLFGYNYNSVNNTLNFLSHNISFCRHDKHENFMAAIFIAAVLIQ